MVVIFVYFLFVTPLNVCQNGLLFVLRSYDALSVRRNTFVEMANTCSDAPQMASFNIVVHLALLRSGAAPVELTGSWLVNFVL